MPRYFFHISAKGRTFWDEAGCDLPDLWRAEDPAMTEAIWHEVFAKQLRPGEILIITDVADQVLFVSGF
jgi:hypothetical protein